jgi:hypothetical protein
MYPSTVPTIKIYSGDTWAQSYEFKAGDPAEPIDFVAEGWTDWAAQWRPTPFSEDFIELDIDISDADVGRIILNATDLQTRMLGDGFIDLQSVNGDEVKTWIRASVVWSEDITR